MKFSFAVWDHRRHPRLAGTLGLMGLVAGFGLGAVAYASHSSVLLGSAPLFKVIGQIWLNALLMVSLPLVVSLLVGVILGAERSQLAGKLGGFSLLWFVAMLVAAGLGTVVAGTALVKWFPASAVTRAAMQASLQGASGAPLPQNIGTLQDWLVNLIPSNAVRALAGGEILPVIVAALLFAIAARSIAEERRLLLQRLFEAISETTLTLMRYILRFLTVAVFSLTFVAVAGAGPAIAGGVAYFVVAVTLLLIAATLLLYPATWWFGKIPVRRFAAAVWPCQVLAMTTRSSLATLPSLLERGRARIGLPAPVAAFVLPLSVSSFKLNRTISTPLKVIVLSHLYGLPVDFGVILLFVAVAGLLSFGTPGLPSHGSMVTLPFYLAAGLPLQGVVLLSAVDAIPDIFKTVLNVTADMSVATIVARAAGFALTPAGQAPIAPLPET